MKIFSPASVGLFFYKYMLILRTIMKMKVPINKWGSWRISGHHNGISGLDDDQKTKKPYYF